MRSGFFNSNITGYDDYGNPIYDRAEEASFFAEFFADFIGNGVYPNPSTGMQVLADSGMNLKVQQGDCFINGYRGKVEEGGETVELDASDSTYARIDRIVARLDIEAREITLEVLKGTPATNPVATGLTRNSNIYELGLADVTIGSNVSVVTQANITDTRLNSSLCGIVSAVIEQVDTTTLFNQYQSWFNEMKAQADSDYQEWFDGFTEPEEQEFIDWFNHMKDQLTEDAAGNLQTQIDEINENVYNKEEIDEAINILQDNKISKDLTLVTDANQATETGFYQTDSATLNQPGSSIYLIQVMKRNDTTITQIAYRFRNNEIWERHYNKVDSETTASWKDWVRIDNGNLTTYSTTEEIKTGETWIDGKPIYRKAINIERITSNNMTASTGITNMNSLVKLKGTAMLENAYLVSIPTDGSATNGVACRLRLESSGTILRIDKSNNTFTNVVVVLEYTKTTD